MLAALGLALVLTATPPVNDDPADGTVVTTPGVTFTWSGAGGPYALQVEGSMPYEGSGTSFTWDPMPLVGETKWRVFDASTSKWSAYTTVNHCVRGFSSPNRG